MNYKPEKSKDYGKAIKHLLEEKNLSQRQFSTKAGLTTDYVSKLVNGRIREPRQEQRRKIAKGLQMKEQELEKRVAQYITGCGEADEDSNIAPIAPTATNDIPDTSSEPLAVRVVGPHQQRELQNLPAPDCTKFIGRQGELKQLLKYLSPNSRPSIITVDGIGGVGKTALVLEAAHLCLEASRYGKSPLNAPIFDAFIFTSAKKNRLLPFGILPRPQGQSTLRDIFWKISQTLDDQSIIQATAEDQLHRVYESLGRQRTLLIVDNMETMEHEEKNKVLAFLYDELPASTKAVITTHKQTGIYVQIRLDCLPKEESLQLIDQQAEEKGVTLSQEESEALYNRFGGIPVALIYLIGQLGRVIS